MNNLFLISFLSIPCRLFFVGAQNKQFPTFMSMIDMKRMTPSPSLLVIVSICSFLWKRNISMYGSVLLSCIQVTNWFFIHIMQKYKNVCLKLWLCTCKDDFNLTMYWNVLDFWTLMFIKFSSAKQIIYHSLFFHHHQLLKCSYQ